MGKKTQFINKKAATTYSVVHRSQQDGEYGVSDEPSEFVLLEQRRPNVRVKDAVTHEGLPNDGYDYRQHMRSMGGGQFVDSSGTATDQTDGRVLIPRDAMSRGDLEEIPRLYEAVTLEPEKMDEAMHAALFDEAGFGDLDEIEDDFIVAASKVDPNAPADFDYDAHIAGLLNNIAGGHEHDDDECTDYDSEEETVVVGSSSKAFADDAFEAALAEYDDSDEDEEEQDEDDLRLALDGGVMEDMMEEAIEEQKKGDLIAATFLDPSKRENNVPRLCEATEKDGVVEDMAVVDAAITAEYDEQDRVAREKESQFDCETILSTLSNLDNHPNTLSDLDDIDEKKKKKKKKSIYNDDLGTVDETCSVAESVVVAPRLRGETPEQRAARKAGVKVERRDRRLEKKDRKLGWKAAESLIPSANSMAPSVFTY